jgi:hypothetical protein
MPETEKNEDLVNIWWLVSTYGPQEEIAIWAAYIQQHTALDRATPQQGGDDLIMTTLKDADHKIVFSAPARTLNYVRRAQPAAAGVIFVPLRKDLSVTLAQIRAVQNALNEATAAVGDLIDGKFAVLPP